MALNFSHVESFSAILMGIYHDDPPCLLSNLCSRVKEVIPYKYSLTSLSSNFDSKFDSFCYESADMPPECIEDYRQHYETMDFCVWYNAQPIRSVYRNTDLITSQGLENSTLYQKWMAPLGIYYTLFANCAARGVNYSVLSFMRSREEGNFTDEEVAFLALVNDHLSERMADLFPNGIGRTSLDPNVSRLASTYRLTQREIDVIEALRGGATRQAIAEELSISPHTLKKHLANIYRKLNIGSTSQLFSILSRYGEERRG